MGKDDMRVRSPYLGRFAAREPAGREKKRGYTVKNKVFGFYTKDWGKEKKEEAYRFKSCKLRLLKPSTRNGERYASI